MKIARLLPLFLLLLSCKPEKSSSAAPALPEYSVSLIPLKKGDIRLTRSWVGQVVSTQQAPIIPQITGIIQQRLFTNGQVVQKGQILYQINPEIYKQSLERAQQEVHSLEASYQKAQQDADYFKPLVENGTVSRRDYTDANQAAQAAKAALDAAKATEEKAKLNLGYCTLMAPMDGVVGFAKAFVGSYVSPSSEPLVLVNTLQPIRIYFSISEQDWISQGGSQGALREGATLGITLSNGSTYPEKAHIIGVDNEVNSKTGSLMLDATVNNPQGLLRPGMYVTVNAAMGEEKDVLLAPVQALVQVQGKNMLLHYHGGTVSMIPVTLGASEGAWVHVSGEGLKVGMELVSKGTQQGMMAAMGRAKLVPKT